MINGGPIKKVLYISEVPVELSRAGATLVYRLLEQYPPDKLLIIQTSNSINDHRLENVRYIRSESKLIYLLKRLKLTQLGNLVNILLKRRISARFEKSIRDFRPDAVITVTFNLSWLTAYRISRQYKIPLLLLLHDDYLGTENYGWLQSYITAKFRKAYLHAQSCFCISPQMEEYYHNIYGKKGQVIYPSRGKNDSTFFIDWEKVQEKANLNFCYAGSIGTTDFLPLMNELAGILGRHGHTLTLFADVSTISMQKYQHLFMPHVRFENMAHPDILKKYIYEHVDVNILLNSFQHEDLFKLNFSSKIVDYTAVNLPVLFWGAPTSGILSWALKRNYPCMIIRNDNQLLEEEITRLEKLSYRKQLAAELQEMAKDTFGFEMNYSVFTEHLN